MSSTADTADTTKKKAKFDLSDGLSSEDFIALGSSLLTFIKKVLIIIFYPFIWLWRELKRIKDFVSSGKASRPLTSEEQRLMMSWPIFLLTFGTSIGAILAVVGFIVNIEDLETKLKDFSAIFSFIGGLIKGLYDVLVIILGGIWDILVAIKNFVQRDLLQSPDFPVPYLFISLVGIVAVIIIVFLMESKFINDLVKKIQDGFSYVFNLPRTVYDSLDRFWDEYILKKIGAPVVGGETLKTHSNLFFKKIIYLSFGFSLVFFLVALTIFLNDPHLRSFEDSIFSIQVLVLIFFLTGFSSGFPVTYAYMKMLDRFSRKNYLIKSVISTQVKETVSEEPVPKEKASKPKTTPTTKPSSTTASTPVKKKINKKELLEARRKAREAMRKKRK